MGIYINPSQDSFLESLNSEIYVDKTGLIALLNPLINSRQKYVCISRPRRFGKSMAIDMLAAYYGANKDTDNLFDCLAIKSDDTYKIHLNQYNVIQVNMQEFLSLSDNMLGMFLHYISSELINMYPDVPYLDRNNLVQIMKDIYFHVGRRFVILIDEWDCLFRAKKNDTESQEKYLDFLRAWLKDQQYVALAYMTGILPIKKYGTHSALNMFSEYSMTKPGPMAGFFGFTEEEVRELCLSYNIDFLEMKLWYDGYRLTAKGLKKAESHSMYSPKSVVEAILMRDFGTYWNNTETYESLRKYITIDMDGLKEKVIRMLGGEHIPIDTSTFANDMTTFTSGDDILTLLVHLGYLSYDPSDGTVKIPNKEVSLEYLSAIKAANWGEIIRAITASKHLLEAIWNKDSGTTAAGIAEAHNEISILKYNDENSLSCTVMLALFFAREFYNAVREFPSGKGFADIVFVPRPDHQDKPVIIIELKKDKSAEKAIAQIKERNYVERFKERDILLVGINYDSRTKDHDCQIESYSV